MLSRSRGELLHQLVETVPRHATEEIPRWHAHIGECELAGVLSMLADFVQYPAASESTLPVGLHDEQRDPLGALARIGLRDDDQQIAVRSVGDERLRPIDHVIVAITNSAGADRLQIRAGTGLRHRDG